MRVRLALAALALALTPAWGETLDGASFGAVRLAAPSNPPQRYVTLFSGAEGWSAVDDETLASLTRQGALAVGIDSRLYLDNLAAHRAAVRPAECVDVFQDVEDLARRAEGEHPSAFYNLPIVAGRGEGGALAYLALAQAPPATLKAAVTLDANPSIAISRPLCRLDAFALQPDGRRRLDAVASLNGEWRQAEAAPGGLTQALETYIAASAATGVAALPLVELPVDGRPPLAAILISGDGGWRDIDKSVGEKLQKLGVPVVGWDALRYFWRKKSPEATAADLAAVIAAYRAKWGVERLALIGYSFGADILPALYNRLSEADRARVKLITLMGLEPRADWQIQVAGWFGAEPSAEATPIAPELAKMPSGLIQCIYGETEPDVACPALPYANAEIIKMPGDHHFNGAYEAIAETIVAALKRRGAL